MKKPLFAVYLLLIVALFFYSYTQVDLGLTLIRIPVWQIIQKSFQYIGYFNRPLSTAFYLTLLVLLYVFYGRILFLTKKLKVTRKQFWLLTGITASILVFSYNAFSYDLFNYMFDAKIVTFYHLNPYEHKALDFSGDPYLGFMRWTHRTYPYGPTWLSLTIPLSFLGWQKFLPTLFLFKAMIGVSFLGAVYFIGKIAEKVNPPQKILAMSFFAFNPLAIIESLVSGHNEIVMMFFWLWSFYLLLNKRYFWAWILFFFSIGIKFGAAFLLPTFLFITFCQMRKKKIPWRKTISGSIFLMILAIISASLRTELQPWYFLLILPLISLLPQERILFWPSIVFSLGLLLHYVFFLYTGNWNPPIPTLKLWLNISLIIFAALFLILEKVTPRLVKASKNVTILKD